MLLVVACVVVLLVFGEKKSLTPRSGFVKHFVNANNDRKANR